MRLNRWQNVAGALVVALTTIGATYLLGFVEKQHIPIWGNFLAAAVGFILWLTIERRVP